MLGPTKRVRASIAVRFVELDGKGEPKGEEGIVTFEDVNCILKDRREYDGTYEIRPYDLNKNARGLFEDGVMHRGMAGHDMRSETEEEQT